MLKKYIKETKWWMYAAGTLPVSALVGILISYYIELDSLLGCIIAASLIVLVSASVFWWWWAIHRIKDVFTKLEVTNENFAHIINELKEIKKEMPYVGDRKRRK